MKNEEKRCKKSVGFFEIIKAAGWLPFVKFVLLFNHTVAVKLQNFNPGVFIFAENGIRCGTVNENDMRLADYVAADTL